LVLAALVTESQVLPQILCPIVSLYTALLGDNVVLKIL